MFAELDGPNSRLPLRSITVNVNPGDEDDLLVTVSGFRTPGMSGGDVPIQGLIPTFVDVSGTGADTLPCSGERHHPRPWNPQTTWYAATDVPGSS